MSGLTVRTDFSGLTARLSGAGLRAAQEAVARRAASEARDYVPVDEGTLRDSEAVSSDYASGRIVWSTPYAREVHERARVRTVKNHNARPHWARVAVEERAEAWADFARSVL